MKHLKEHINQEQNIIESLSNSEQDILTASIVTAAIDFKHGNVTEAAITPLYQMSKILKIYEKVSSNYAQNDDDPEQAEPRIYIELMEFTNKVAMKKFGFVSQYMLEYFAANYMSI